MSTPPPKAPVLSVMNVGGGRGGTPVFSPHPGRTVGPAPVYVLNHPFPMTHSLEKNPVPPGTVGTTLGATYVLSIGAPSTVESIGGHVSPSLSTTALASLHTMTKTPSLYSTHLTCSV